MRGKVLVFATLAMLAIANVRTESLTEKTVKEMLLTDDGQDVDLVALRSLAEQLIELNQQAGLFKHHGHRHDQPYPSEASKNVRATSNLALNDYVTVGRKPSTTPFLGLSSGCDICASLVSIAGRFVGTSKLWPTLINATKQLCPGITGGMSQVACDGYIDTFDPIVFYIWPTLIKSPYSLCGAIFKNLGCGTPDHQHFLWQLPLPAPLAESVPQVTPPTPPTKDKVRVLHMTDIHIDPEYEEGTPAACLEPMCCRRSSTPARNPMLEGDKAGYWGDYRLCDIPKWTFEEILREINETHGNDIDIVFVAGDLPPHDTWNQSGQVHLEVIDYVANQFAQKLPGKPVFFAVGNHEMAPVNAYPLPGDPAKFNMQWLYDNLTSVWTRWIDPETASATITKAGFYTTVLKPGWRLITINDNYCLTGNFFLFGRANITDPYEVLTWMIKILSDAEKNGERVQIMGHIPPGEGGCLQAYSWNYYRIISRFSHIITGQFFGHIHKDYFVMYYDAETLTEPRGVAFIGPPSTPFSRNNIGFRLYDFDSTTFKLLNYYNYYADVDAANKNGNRKTLPWKLEHSALEDYGLADMSPASWSDFAKRMQTDSSLFNKYRTHYQLSITDIAEPCGFECRRHRLCEAYQGLSNVPDSWCERWYPTLKSQANEAEELSRKCSTRFIKRPN